MRHLLTLLSKGYRQQQAIKARLARIQLLGEDHGQHALPAVDVIDCSAATEHHTYAYICK